MNWSGKERRTLLFLFQLHPKTNWMFTPARNSKAKISGKDESLSSKGEEPCRKVIVLPDPSPIFFIAYIT
jgi:hypothetical protein